MDEMAASVPAGSGGLVFLPYLNGERTPHMDPLAKGMFIGLNVKHEASHIVRSVMEGVCYALKNSVEIFTELGLHADRIIASGGGANSPLWLQMQANVLNKEVVVSTVSEQAAFGACILAGIGAGVFESAQQACRDIIKFQDKVYRPDTGTITPVRRPYTACTRNCTRRTVISSRSWITKNNKNRK